jgi:hypothetical protein
MTKAALVEGPPTSAPAHGSGGGCIDSLPTVAAIITSVMTEADGVLRGWSA